MFPGNTVSEVWERITKPNIKTFLNTINPLSTLNPHDKLPYLQPQSKDLLSWFDNLIADNNNE